MDAASSGRPPDAGHGPRAGPGGPAHARAGHPRRQPGEEAVHHQVRPWARPGPGPRQPQLHRPRPDALWVADFTYCSTWSGIVYVAFIIDVFSRRLVGWKAARSMTAALVVDALNMAAWTRRHTTLDGLICHTDAGSQYTSVLYTDRIDEVGAAPSIGTVGDSFDNAMAESVMGIFKTELHRNPAALAANGGPWRGTRRPRDRHLCVGVVVQRGAAALRTRRPDASRSRRRLPSQVSARRGMRNPNN